MQSLASVDILAAFLFIHLDTHGGRCLCVWQQGRPCYPTTLGITANGTVLKIFIFSHTFLVVLNY